jgi:hypothetical protein
MLQQIFDCAADRNSGGIRIVVDAGGGDSSAGTAALYEELGLEYLSLPVPKHGQTRGALYMLQKQHREGDFFEDSKWGGYLGQLLRKSEELALRLAKYPTGGGLFLPCPLRDRRDFPSRGYCRIGPLSVAVTWFVDAVWQVLGRSLHV